MFLGLVSIIYLKGSTRARLSLSSGCSSNVFTRSVAFIGVWKGSGTYYLTTFRVFLTEASSIVKNRVFQKKKGEKGRKVKSIIEVVLRARSVPDNILSIRSFGAAYSVDSSS